MLRRILLVSLLSLAVPAAALAAGAKAKKKTDAAAVKAALVPKANEKAVADIIGVWKWGMAPEEVLGALQKQLTEQRAAELAKISDVYAQTQIRKQVKADVDNVRKSLTKFEGQKTGWDVSIIEGEFLHRNGEAMMLYRETDQASGRDQQRFFFFKDSKLWKQFIAFNMEPYKGKTFSDFREAMESRYGKGAPIVKKVPGAADRTVAVAWRAGGTYLRAVDLTQFYSNFCLAISDETVEQQMEAARAERAPKAGVPRVVVSDGKGGGDKVIDPNADVIDRITGGQAATPGMPRSDGDAAGPDPRPPAPPSPVKP